MSENKQHPPFNAEKDVQLQITIQKIENAIASIYGTGFPHILNFEYRKRTGKEKNILWALIEEPKETYNFLISFFKGELGLKIFIESLAVKAHGETASRELTENLLNSIKENSKEKILNYIKELTRRD